MELLRPREGLHGVAGGADTMASVSFFQEFPVHPRNNCGHCMTTRGASVEEKTKEKDFHTTEFCKD